MKRFYLALAAFGALALAGCNQTVQDRAATLPPGTPKAVVVKTVIDDKIAAASVNLASQCTLVKIALTGASLFVTGATASKWLANIRVSVAQFCDAPPADVEGALMTLQRIYREINTRVPETQAYVRDEWAKMNP